MSSPFISAVTNDRVYFTFYLPWCSTSPWLWLAVPWLLAMLSIFSYTCWLFVYLLLKNVCSHPLPILGQVIHFHAVDSSFSYILDINYLSDVNRCEQMCLQTFSPVPYIVSLLGWIFPLQCRRFLTWWNSSCLFWLWCLCCWSHARKCIAQVCVKNLPPCVVIAFCF